MGAKDRNFNRLMIATRAASRTRVVMPRDHGRCAIIGALLSVILFLSGCALTGSGNDLRPESTNLNITTSSLAAAQEQSSYQAAVSVSGGIAPYLWTVDSGSLPTGLTLTSATGEIAGSPTQGGTFNFSVQVCDSSSPLQSVTHSYSIVVSKPGSRPTLSITTGSMPTATVGSSYMMILGASGGTSPYTWKITSGSLPGGISLGTSTGKVSGTPKAEGTSSFTVRVQDSNDLTASAALRISVETSGSHSTLSITTGGMPSGMVGASYKVTLAASGGTTPYKWSITSGSLPAGLSLNSSTGLIGGVPSEQQSASFIVKVTDSAENTAQGGFSLNISAKGRGSTLTITTPLLPGGQVSKSYWATLTASNGRAPYTWSVVPALGVLPSGLSLNASTGTISGTPTKGGISVFTAQVADSSSPPKKAEQGLSITVATAADAGLDAYGGDVNHPCSSGATGYFYVHQDSSDKRWWFCDPTGNRFFMLAVQVVDESDADGYPDVLKNKYGDDHFGGFSQLLSRLESYGFNTVGDDSSWYALPIATPSGPGNPVQQPFIWQIHPSDGFKNPNYSFKDVVSLTSGAYTGYRTDSFPDVFDPNYINYANSGGPGPSPWGGSAPFPSFSALDASPWLLGVDLDDGDRTWGFKINDDPTSGVGPSTAWLVAADAPYEIYSGRFSRIYSDPVMHIKAELATWLQGTTDSGPGYTTISKLNAAWGSSYSTFGTAGVAVTGEVIGIGNGSTITFSHTLKHTVADPFSLAIVAGGTTVSGDCPWFDNISWELGSNNYDCGQGIPSGTGVFGAPTGSSVSGGTINYKTGALILTFSKPPAAGQVITVNYIYGGWPHALTGGTGLMDEDGTSPWFPSSFDLPDLLLPNPPRVDFDLDNFLGHMADQYFSTLSSAVRSKVPHHLVFTQEFLGAYDRPTILQHAGKYVDAVVVQDVDTSSQLVKAYQYANKPLFLDERFIANPDSQFSSYPCDSVDNPAYACQLTQAGRGSAYSKQMATDLALTGNDGYGFVVGWDYWEMTDKTSERQNFGLVTPLDNGYDGIEDRMGPQPCFPEITVPGYVCGKEPANHGDFVTSVTSANKLWLSLF